MHLKPEPTLRLVPGSSRPTNRRTRVGNFVPSRCHGVRTETWVECMQSLFAAGADVLIEVGPGKVLCGLMRQIDSARKTLNVEDTASLEKTLAELAGSAPAA